MRWTFGGRLEDHDQNRQMTRTKQKAVYALAMLGLFGTALMVFIFAANEQSVITSGLPAAHRISLQDLVAGGAGTNKHIELVDFYCGKSFVYTTELIQFNEVYVPVFARGEPEDGACALCLGGTAVCAVLYRRHQ
jgi:hypothetical protein